MSIKPDYFTLDGLLQKKLFRIPEYQRAYSWESKQRDDLFNDIRNLTKYEDGRHHFMSTVVCLKTNSVQEIDTDEFTIYEVVDGQQRITTLIILLKAIFISMQKENNLNVNIADNLNDLLIKADGRLILLQTNHDNSFFFRDYLLKGLIPEKKNIRTQSDRNIVDAIKHCENFVDSWEKGALDLLKIIKNRLDFIFYVLEEEHLVYTIFEVLNSRGLEVDWLDKCKSILMGISFEKFSIDVRKEYIDQLHQYWTNIYKTIGLKKVPGHEVIRFAATFLHPDSQNRILSAEQSLQFLKDAAIQNPKSVIDISNLILKISQELESLFDNRRLGAVTDIIHARLLAVSILLSEVYNDELKNELLEYWEKVTFRIFGLARKDSRTKIGEYTRLAQKVIKKELTKDDLIDEIQSIGNDTDHSISTVVARISNSDCYNGWENDLRYIFYRYEEYLAKKQNVNLSEDIWEQIWNLSPSSTIEHIYPQTTTDAWKGKLGRGRNVIEKNVNRIGNLMLLPPNINSKARNKSFKEKKKIYKENFHLRLMQEIIAKRDWNLASINEREKRLLEFIKDTWG